MKPEDAKALIAHILKDTHKAVACQQQTIVDFLEIPEDDDTTSKLLRVIAQQATASNTLLAGIVQLIAMQMISEADERMNAPGTIILKPPKFG